MEKNIYLEGEKGKDEEKDGEENAGGERFRRRGNEK